MFSFHWPWAILLLPLPVLVALFWPRPHRTGDLHSEGGRSILRHPAVARLESAFVATNPRKSFAQYIRNGLLAALWVALVLTLMRPQWLESHTEIKTEGYDLMLAVDVSRSMEALDFSVGGDQVTRMAVIKGVVGRFVEGRGGDRIGLTVFGNHAYVLSPLTLDVQAVRGLVDGMLPRMAGDGTAIGDAIGLSVKKLRERPQGSRVLLLVTDGENTSGTLPPLVATRLAAEEGIRIYTIGVGSQGLVPILEDDGKLRMENMEIDEPLLRDIAALTGGAYYRATNANALEEIYRQIDTLEKTQAESRSVMIPTPLYRWPLGLALLILLTMGMFPDGKRRVWVSRDEYV